MKKLKTIVTVEIDGVTRNLSDLTEKEKEDVARSITIQAFTAIGYKVKEGYLESL